MGLLIAWMTLGHVSNLVSLQSCERHVLRKSLGNLKEKLVFNRDAMTLLLDSRLKEVGLDYEVLSPEEWWRRKGCPSCDLHQAVPVMPFLVAIDYWEHTGNLGGWGGRVYLLNFFGLSWIVWTDAEFVS